MNFAKFSEHLRTTISVQFTMYFATGYNKFVFSDTYCNRVYKTINYFETPLGDKTTTIFTCCLALDNKIERLRSVISLTKLCIEKFVPLIFFDIRKNDVNDVSVVSSTNNSQGPSKKDHF